MAGLDGENISILRRRNKQVKRSNQLRERTKSIRTDIKSLKHQI
jgi:hypothetical protein